MPSVKANFQRDHKEKEKTSKQTLLSSWFLA
jgi:hypothetical protein